MRLGLNIDHIAYLRESRKINDPDPLDAISIAKRCNVDQITIHLREDRRHINEWDVKRITQCSFLPLNIECGANEEIINIICKFAPFRVTLVPEKRQEVTTEGGLLLHDGLKNIIDKLLGNDIEVAAFIDPSIENLKKASALGINQIELHTGKYANLSLMLYSNLSHSPNAISEFSAFKRNELQTMIENEIENLKNISQIAHNDGFKIYAGHGLNYYNTSKIAQIENIEELNIGQSIIARSVFSGLERAIKDMVDIIRNARESRF